MTIETAIIFCFGSIHNKCGAPGMREDYSSYLKVQWNSYQLEQILQLI